MKRLSEVWAWVIVVIAVVGYGLVLDAIETRFIQVAPPKVEQAAPVKPPALTTDQSNALKVVMLEWEKARVASSPKAMAEAIAAYITQVQQAEIQAAQTAQKVYASMPQVEGWTLDPQTGVYSVKKD
jgi:hypothetical protein